VISATVDTNILISGLVYRRGKPHDLLQQALAGEISLTISQPIVDEMADVLARKFGATLEEIAEAREIVAKAAKMVSPTAELNVISHDPPDDRVLECAVSAGSDYIVTGDKDLLRLKQFNGIRIFTAAELLDIASSQQHAR
jgi:uncharacterized protein